MGTDIGIISILFNYGRERITRIYEKAVKLEKEKPFDSFTIVNNDKRRS